MKILRLLGALVLLSFILPGAAFGQPGSAIQPADPPSTSAYLPVIAHNSDMNPPPPLVCGQVGNPTLEGFEGAASGWKVGVDTAQGGSVVQSSAQAAAGSASALASTSAISATAQVQAVIDDPASSHTWGEIPGTYHWQQACVYIPSSSVSQLGSGQYLTLAGTYPSAGGPYGWYLQVGQNGALSVLGHPGTGNIGQPTTFSVYGQVPLDQWFELEIGLHSQLGDGVKRAFAFLVNGNFYGWYHQGNMQPDDNFDRMAMGILNTNTAAPLQVYVDEWRQPGSSKLPNGPDLRSTADLQTQNYRSQSGVQWQIDWSTWANDLALDPRYGIYSRSSRLQSGRNIDRMPDLTNGWAEIEIDWPQGTPPTTPISYFGPMVGFRKEIAREQNMEVIPIGDGTGNVFLTLEAWVNGGPITVTHWLIPSASINSSTHIPEPGDIIRATWDQTDASTLHVQASYYDASASKWYANILDYIWNDTNIGGIDFTDGNHTASSITIDTQYYSIRRFTVGTLPTYPGTP